MHKATWIIAALLVSSSGPALATPVLATSEEEPQRRSMEIHLGMLAGGTDIGDVRGPGVGVELNVGPRFGNLVLLGQFDYLGVGESSSTEDARRGSQARIGLLARYTFLDMGGEKGPLGVGFWLEGGGGRQHVAWDRGGTLTRNDITLGLGLQLDAHFDRDSNTRRSRYLGPYFAFRANIARAPEAADGTEPSCGGPCDTATTPNRTDISLFFNFGMHWGR